MEKSSIHGNWKQHVTTNNARNSKADNYSYKFKSSPWDFAGSKDGDGDLFSGFSWPPRSYTCSFCRREFRSAQALGGHMNVHRRDRARLNQSPVRDRVRLNQSPVRDHIHSTSSKMGQFPLLNLTLDPNPSSAPLSLNYPKYPHLPPPLTPTSTINADNIRRSTDNVVKKAEFVRLDLEIGLITQSYEEELDLELRLGFTT